MFWGSLKGSGSHGVKSSDIVWCYNCLVLKLINKILEPMQRTVELWLWRKPPNHTVTFTPVKAKYTFLRESDPKIMLVHLPQRLAQTCQHLSGIEVISLLGLFWCFSFAAALILQDPAGQTTSIFVAGVCWSSHTSSLAAGLNSKPLKPTNYLISTWWRRGQLTVCRF